MRRPGLATLLVVLLPFPIWGAPPRFQDHPFPEGGDEPAGNRGAAFGDVDNDGDWDLYVSDRNGPNRLYLNDGDGTFTDGTVRFGGDVGDSGDSPCSVFFDYDNDGWVDLYLAKGGRYETESNRLLKNRGGRFVDVTHTAGVGAQEFTNAAAVADYDGDGYLDLYLANYGVGIRNTLYRNNGDGTFTDVTEAAGVGDRSWSWMASWADVNGDNYPDLYVVNGRYPDGEPNTLYVNNGNGTFRDASEGSGVADARWGLGASFADVDRDGDLDLFVSNYVGPNALYLNDGTGKFTEATEAGLADQGCGTGSVFGDIDHDGRPDLYEGDCKLANQLYHNDGAGRFADITPDNPELRCVALRTASASLADVDADGDLDLYVVTRGAENKLLKNGTDNSNWLKVRLSGTRSNRMAIGSRVWVRDGENLIGMSDLGTSSGWCAQPPQEVHFGIDASRTYTVEIRFPSGIRVVLEDVEAGQVLQVTEPEEIAAR